MKNDNNYKTTLLLGGVSFCAYTACYAGRSVLSAIMPEMLKSNVYDKADFAYMGSAYFFTYGIGQIISGIMGDKIKAKYMVSIGLFLASITIFIFPFITKTNMGILLWGLCGLVLSMLWGPLTKVIAENTNPRLGQLLLTALSAASILGTMAAYIIATIASAYGQWKFAFYISAILLLLGSVIWYFCLYYLEKKNALKNTLSKSSEAKKNKELIGILIENSIIPMIFVAMINGVIRNAVTFWIPTYILEKLGALPTLATGITSVLPLINLAGVFTGVFLLKKLKDNEHMVSIVLFLLSTVMFISMCFINGRLFMLSIIFLFIASAAMAALGNMLFTSYCLRFRETGKISTVSGFLNFTSYASSAIASIVFVNLVSKTGWNFIVLTWAILTFVGAIFAYLALKNKNYIFK